MIIYSSATIKDEAFSYYLRARPLTGTPYHNTINIDNYKTIDTDIICIFVSVKRYYKIETILYYGTLYSRIIT